MRYNANDSDMDYEEVEVAGVRGLFTGYRVDPDTVPSDLVMYEVRHDDECQGIPCEIAKKIMVNFWGTLLLEKTLDEVESNGSAIINEETDWFCIDSNIDSLEEWRNSRCQNQ